MSAQPIHAARREQRASRVIRFLTIAAAAAGTTLTLWGFSLAIH